MTHHLGLLNAQAPGLTAIAPLDESWFNYANRCDFSHRRRAESEFGARTRYTTIWPTRPTLFSGDFSAGFNLDRDGTNASGRWSTWQLPMRGGNNEKFIIGYCVDESNNAIGGAIVQGFLTSNDQFVSQTTCDDTGRYELPTSYSGAQHYLVAYVAGSPDKAGTTVNTLTPTNRDGT